MAAKKYVIHNTTRKDIADYRSPEGKDLRTNLEKIGHTVSIQLIQGDKEKSLLIPAGGRPVYISELDEGILDLQQQGVISIEEYAGLEQAMEDHKISADRSIRPRRPLAATGSVPTPTPPVAEEAAAGARDERIATRQGRAPSANARATKTGQEDHSPRGGRELEDARNPDGEPNFLSKATEVKRVSRKTQEASV